MMDQNSIIESGGFYFIHNFDSGNLGHVERVPTDRIGKFFFNDHTKSKYLCVVPIIISLAVLPPQSSQITNLIPHTYLICNIVYEL